MPSRSILQTGGIVAALVTLGAAMFFVWPGAGTPQLLGVMLTAAVIVFSFIDLTAGRLVAVGVGTWLLMALPYIAPLIVGAFIISLAFTPLVFGWYFGNLLNYSVSKLKGNKPNV